MAQYLMAPIRRMTLIADDRLYNGPSLRVTTGESDEEGEELEYINLNVGGVLFRTCQQTLSRIPDTKLSNLNHSRSNYDHDKDEYFFDRNSAIFPWILDCYRTKEMHVPRSFCAIAVREELEFWGLGKVYLGECCKKAYLDSLDDITTNEILLQEFNDLPKNVYAVESETNEGTSLRMTIWNFLDKPQSSLRAQIWSYLYLILTVLSILTFFIETIPESRVKVTRPGNNTVHDIHANLSNQKIKMLLTTDPHSALVVFDVFCMMFFTIEFIIRVGVCPRRKRLMVKTTTIFDLLYLVPAWLTTLIYWVDRDFWRHPERMGGFLVLQAFKVLRVFRIFRIMSHFHGLRILWLAVKASVRELVLLVVFIMLSITIFACFIYCAEIFNENSFDNAAIGLWWALITMTTVGYGDFHPDTWIGYIVGGVCALTGIILIGMPVPIIASNFHAYYGLRIPEECLSDEGFRNEERVSSPEPVKRIRMKKRRQVSPVRR